MDVDTQQVIDTLARVASCPASASLWNLLSRQLVHASPDHKASLIQRIAALQLPDATHDWLRCSALAFITGDPRWYARQAALAVPGQSLESLMTLLGLAWHHGINHFNEREGFAEFFRAIGAGRLLQLCAEQLPALPAPVRRKHTLGKVAVYTPDVSSARHGGTAFLLNVMALLVRAGIACKGFTAQEGNIPATHAFTGGDAFLSAPAMDAGSLQLPVPGNIEIVVPLPGYSLTHNLGELQAQLADYDPDLVVFIGFYSPLVLQLSAHYPVLGMSIHAMQPLVPAEMWLSSQEQGAAAVWPWLAGVAHRFFPYRFWGRGAAKPAELAAIGITPAQQVLVTTGYRLDKELQPQWCARVLAVLAGNPHLVWLLVGRIPSWLVGNAQVVCVPPRDDLPEVFAACHVYLNPPRTGGGASVALAMEQGIAVLTLTGNDAADKVGDLAAATHDDYFDRLQVYAGNAAQREHHGACLRQRFAERLDISSAQAGTDFLQACEATLHLFDLRNPPDA